MLVIDGEHALRRRGEPFGDAELLERLAGPVGDRNEADEEDECGRILPCSVEGDHRVRRTGTAGDHGYAGPSGQAGFGHGHEPGAAFLSAHDGLDGGVIETVEHVEVGLAGDRAECFSEKNTFPLFIPWLV